MKRNSMISRGETHLVDGGVMGDEMKMGSSETPAFDAAVSIVIASIYSGNCPREHISELLREVHQTATDVLLHERKNALSVKNEAAAPDRAEQPIPAVPIEDSVSEDYIVCLEDGKKLQLLKRYLRRAYGMTPEQYKLRWGLPDDYPMIAPSLSEKRSLLVRDIKPYLARKRRKEPEFALVD